MAKFHAPKAYHFSEDGTDEKAWAKFTKVPGSGTNPIDNPVVFEFETNKPKDVAALRKLVDGKVEGYGDIKEVKEDKPKDDDKSKDAKDSGGSNAANGGATGGAGDPNAATGGQGGGQGD